MKITLCSVETHGPYVLAELLLDGCLLRTVLRRHGDGTLTTEELPREIEGTREWRELNYILHRWLDGQTFELPRALDPEDRWPSWESAEAVWAELPPAPAVPEMVVRKLEPIGPDAWSAVLAVGDDEERVLLDTRDLKGPLRVREVSARMRRMDSVLEQLRRLVLSQTEGRSMVLPQALHPPTCVEAWLFHLAAHPRQALRNKR